jgi:6-pyruvoyltetrahydropterin/6-carboxytetrahydropterin synthase
MSRIRITKIFHFEMAHALENYDGACRHIHGHSYRLEVTVSGIPIKDPDAIKLGMVMDFGELKRMVNEHIVDVFDHAFVVKNGYEQALLSQYGREEMRLIVTDFQPTSEMLLNHFAEVLLKVLPAEIRLERLKLFETVNSFAEWCREDQ